MSVRDGILAILTVGPAYGHQLLAEFTARAPHRGPVNVGQIYATLDRLGKQSLVEPAGSTPDGLPLHALTPAGSTVARAWMRSPALDPLPDWTELLDQLLITSSIDPGAAATLADAYSAAWSAEVDRVEAAAATSSHDDRRLALLARRAHARAVVHWMAEASAPLADPGARRAFDQERPRRGRRPRPAAQP